MWRGYTLQLVSEMRRGRAILHRWGVDGAFLASAASYCASENNPRVMELWNSTCWCLGSCWPISQVVPLTSKNKMIFPELSHCYWKRHLYLRVCRYFHWNWWTNRGVKRTPVLFRDRSALLQGRGWPVVINTTGGGGLAVNVQFLSRNVAVQFGTSL